MSEQEQKASTEKVYSLARKDGGAVSLMPQNLEEAYRLATRLANSGLVPREMQGSADSVLAAMLLANELGVGPMAGLTNIAVVNGRAYVWGELLTGLVWQSGLCEMLDVTVEGQGMDAVATAKGKRKGQGDVVTRTFTMKQALAADLVGPKSKPMSAWAKYPTEMLQNRAMSRLIKFLWPDVVKGLRMRELKEDDRGEIEIERATAIVVEAEPAPKKDSSTFEYDINKPCPHCGGDPKVANPTGNCSHIHYPEAVNTHYIKVLKEEKPVDAEIVGEEKAPAPKQEEAPKPKQEDKKHEEPKELGSTPAMVKGLLDRVTYKTEGSTYVYRIVLKAGEEQYRYIVSKSRMGGDYVDDKALAKHLKDNFLNKMVQAEVDPKTTEVLSLKVIA